MESATDQKPHLILGISGYYHDSAACLVKDGHIVAAAQEERFTRKKHDHRFPSHAIRYCLQEGQVALRDVNYVAFYEKPLVKFERLIETYLSFAPRGLLSFWQAIPVWLKEKLFLKEVMKKELRSNDEAKTGRQSRSGQACPESQTGDSRYVRGRREDPDRAGRITWRRQYRGAVSPGRPAPEFVLPLEPGVFRDYPDKAEHEMIAKA